ncbi:MAG: ATP-dependent DNA helicase RecG [Treponema sp.]|jgi:ATP-dependent DNA helicase RecG|nr:ATP-dependent DNA helicase RecG [Treponema sp.]
MFVRELKDPLIRLNGAWKKTPEKLEDFKQTVMRFSSAGIISIADLLLYYPREWVDRTRTVPLKDFDKKDEKGRKIAVCTIAKVIAHEWVGFGVKRGVKVHIDDGTARAVLTFWKYQETYEKKLTVGEKFWISCKFSYNARYGEIQSSSKIVYKRIADESTFKKLFPIYPLTKEITQREIESLIRLALRHYITAIEDEIPLFLREKYGFLPKHAALTVIHAPSEPEELEKAKNTLIYEELFYLETMIGKKAMTRKARQREGEAKSGLQGRLLERLPFSLTEGQVQAVREINSDMDGPFPMARLLQGDVGSGKTLVAFLACLHAIENNGQAAILAPTELLARQHAENAAKLLEPLGVWVAFLTGNVKAAGRTQLLKNLASGEIDLVIGTHALFSKDVVYRDLRLVVIDEQHRFGVLQRQAIIDKGGSPDLLMMSATPIPRTLAITVFGDLDVSIIQDMPPGRKPIETHLARESNETKVYDFVRRRLMEGAQAYFVYPLIEEGEQDLKNAASMAERLVREVFPEYKTALIHSRLDEEEKRQTMEAFRRGDTHILAATSVVEVGVDVPNATCMVIEHAERFGLSALHQLRGRVGRGSAQSYCFLVYSDEYTEDAKNRLMVMLENSDGFLIAEEDLKLRGPGQIAGFEQSGYVKLGMADIVRDSAVLEQARTDAFAMLEKDPGLLLPEDLVVSAVLERCPPWQDIVF